MIENKDEDKAYLFSYGSMKKGFYNSYMLSEQEFIGEVTTVAGYEMYPSSDYYFPYMFKTIDNGLNIKGELYLVDNDFIKNTIDKIENVDGGQYVRRNIEVILPSGQKIWSFAYIATSNITEKHCDKGYMINEWTKEMERKGFFANAYIESMSARYN